MSVGYMYPIHVSVHTCMSHSLLLELFQQACTIVIKKQKKTNQTNEQTQKPFRISNSKVTV